jgi:hypothetical protein
MASSMRHPLAKIAAALAFIIGVMAIFAGGQVLLGQLPDYYVINWLPIYNFIAGVVSALVVAVLIWRESSYALPAAALTFGAHAVVMIVIRTAYGDVVAPDSLRAMTIRLAVWLMILVLLFLQSRRGRVTTV